MTVRFLHDVYFNLCLLSPICMCYAFRVFALLNADVLLLSYCLLSDLFDNTRNLRYCLICLKPSSDVGWTGPENEIQLDWVTLISRYIHSKNEHRCLLTTLTHVGGQEI